jgi:transposase-like protein
MPVFREAKHCLFDGTFLYGRCGIIAMMSDRRIISGSYGLSERPKDLNAFFSSLKKQGFMPSSATIDGKRAVILALKTVWPEIIIQRCVVHVQRQGLMWCRRFPKRTDARRLRKLFLALTYIHTKGQKQAWLRQLLAWETAYGRRIAISDETGWVFSDLKRARSMIIKALPNLFHYLNHPEISRTTNSLEGYFGRLKDRYHDHRGISRKWRKSYFQWYMSLCPK